LGGWRFFCGRRAAVGEEKYSFELNGLVIYCRRVEDFDALDVKIVLVASDEFKRSWFPRPGKN